MKRLILLMIILMPIVHAALPNTTLQPYDLNGAVNPSEGVSPECRREFDVFLDEQPEELIERYCTSIQFRAIIIIIIVMVMWLLEPLIRRSLSNEEFSKELAKLKLKPSSLIFLYKWVGMGLLFIAVWALMRV